MMRRRALGSPLSFTGWAILAAVVCSALSLAAYAVLVFLNV